LSKDAHPHIISYVDSWEHGSRLYIRTALAPCGDLSTFLLSLADQGGLGEARVWKVLAELSAGLTHVHRCNFLHLDIKPSNILVTAAGSLQIADFGLSTILTSGGTVGGVSPALPTAINGNFVWEEGSTGNVPVPSPIMDRELEGDREYLCPEALKESVGKEADVFS
jgi:mitosis inhibitor protein kinase SWE1